MRKRAPCRLILCCRSLYLPGWAEEPSGLFSVGGTPGASGPMKKSSALSPKRAMPMAGWMRYLIGITQSSFQPDSPDDSQTSEYSCYSGLAARLTQGADGYQQLGQPERWS